MKNLFNPHLDKYIKYKYTYDNMSGSQKCMNNKYLHELWALAGFPADVKPDNIENNPFEDDYLCERDYSILGGHIINVPSINAY